MVRASLLCALIAAASFFWLAIVTPAACVVGLDFSLAQLALVGGTVATMVLILLAAAKALHQRWDERRSRAWRLTEWVPK